MKCKHCSGSGHMGPKKWVVKRTVVQEAIVEAVDREEAKKIANEITFARSETYEQVTAHPVDAMIGGRNRED